jgi:hypothetical protein
MKIKKVIILIFSLYSHFSNASLNFDTGIKLINFNNHQAKKIKKATELIKKIVRSEEFKNRVLEFEYKGKKQFFDNLGLTNQEIYERIINGAETMNPEKNSKMDVEIELYHEKTNTIGYTYPNVVRIWMNKKYFEKYSPVQVADNLFHEWMHKLGFDHALRHNQDRPYSVPYALGYLIEELAAKYREP